MLTTAGPALAWWAAQPAAEPLVDKVLVALLAGAIGFGFAVLLERIKARREPRKRLSWDADVRLALLEPDADSDIQSKVTYLYNGEVVTTLTQVSCTITNTGNRVVKDHDLRFPFGDGVRLLEHYLDPQPEEELGVTHTGTGDTRGRESCRYRIAHLERGQSVVFHFVTAGGPIIDWEPVSFNAEGDVEFQRRDVSIARDDQRHLLPFAVVLVLALLVPGVLAAPGLVALGVPERVSELARPVAQVGLLVWLLGHLGPVVRVVRRFVSPKDTAGSLGNAMQGGSVQGNVVQIGTVTGRIHIDSPREGDGEG